MKPYCPVDHFLVEIDKKFQDIVDTESGVLLYRDTTFHPEQHATITGKNCFSAIKDPRAIDTTI
jgi:hypothetical protein